ncbi:MULTISPECIES: DUF6269 family protein [Streptomyces]|uniref:Uncharacterized protein n=1 Tax=Streptomyces luteosporeus TaxID=173856 RepID=A0ABP6G2D7_9ACTN
MNNSQNAPAQVQHPLEFLKEIEQQASLTQETLLRDNAAPWAELLAQYVDALTELAAQGKFDNPREYYGLDDSHAGGCG